MLYYMPSMSNLVYLHNEARSKSWFKKPELQANDLLMVYASDWADAMASNETLTHSRIKNIMKLGFSKAAENIARGQQDEKQVMSTWLNSAGHRANIMNSSYNSIGCSFSYSDEGVLYWCVCFGKSKVLG